MKTPFLQAVNLTKTYGGVRALSDFSLVLNTHEIHGLVGENGAGKSTFVKIITGVIRPDSGYIIVGGKHYQFLTPLQALKLGIQVVHQDLSLFPNLTVAENIFIFQYSMKKFTFVNWRDMKILAEKIIKDLCTDIPANIELSLLSVGDRQVVAIARAIAAQARVLVLDEPTAALSHSEIIRLFEILKKLKDQGLAILIISHKLDEILSITDYVTVIRDGQKIGTYETCNLNKEKLEFLMTGRTLQAVLPGPLRERGEVILKVEGLSRPGQFEDVTFELHEGEVLGLIGPLGSGRTELALCIVGANRPRSGKILFQGKEVMFSSPKEAIKHGVVYCPEDRLIAGLFLGYSVATNLSAPNFDLLLNRLHLVSPSAIRCFSSELINRFGIKARTQYDPVWSLSGGNQQKVVLGKLLAKKPKVLIVDKPTFGIDVATKTAIHQILRDLANEGTAILLISDEAGEVLRCADRILIMREGRIVSELLPESVGEKELYSLIFGGMSENSSKPGQR
ncbi:MAG: sugar ABC transporter ATP-binding protein [Candidatus Bathyarchaeia archaeon]